MPGMWRGVILDTRYFHNLDCLRDHEASSSREKSVVAPTLFVSAIIAFTQRTDFADLKGIDKCSLYTLVCQRKRLFSNIHHLELCTCCHRRDAPDVTRHARPRIWQSDDLDYKESRDATSAVAFHRVTLHSPRLPSRSSRTTTFSSKLHIFNNSACKMSAPAGALLHQLQQLPARSRQGLSDLRRRLFQQGMFRSRSSLGETRRILTGHR